jgi:tetratricopeptide (TPR) repeat protein
MPPGPVHAAARSEGDAVVATPFVGREPELAVLRAGLEAALTGAGGLSFLVGEAGIGKTRTSAELVAAARGRGVEVLVGRCHEGDGAPAYWPWIQAIRGWLAARSPADVAATLGPWTTDVTTLLPSLRDAIADRPFTPAVESELARERLFEGVAAFLRAASVAQPLLLVLDDLHDADIASIRLLAAVARELAGGRAMILGTYREVDLRRRPAAEALADVMSRLPHHRIALAGLGVSEVEEYIASSVGIVPSARMVSAVHRETDGNPLFLSELVRLLACDGGLARAESSGRLPIPPGVREVIGTRLDLLTEECSTILGVAAIIGREFGTAVLERVADVPPAAVHLALREAAAERIVLPLDEGAGAWRFTHTLVRETLYQEVSARRRIELHGRVGEAIETLESENPDARLDTLAHHFFESALDVNREKALHYTLAAARRAASVLAWEEAAALHRRALEILEHLSGGSGTRVADTLLALGEANARAGDATAARAAFRRAADEARRVRAPYVLARAALGVGGAAPMLGVADVEIVRLLEEARIALPDDDSVVRARVLGRLAMELAAGGRQTCREALAEQAVAMARRLGDVETLAYALSARRHLLWRPEHLRERLAEATELATLADSVGRVETALEARTWRLVDLLELGEIAAVEDEIEQITAIATAGRHPLYLYRADVYRAGLALLAGRFDAAEELAQAFLAKGERVSGQNAFGAFAAVMSTLYRVRGGPLEDLVPVARRFIEEHPELSAMRAGVASLYFDTGRLAEAREEFARVAAAEFSDLPQNPFLPAAVCMLARACTQLGDVRRAAAIYELLLPWAGLNVAVGLGADCYGAASRYLAMLATTMERWEDAERHFEDALATNARMGAAPYVALTQEAYAAMLLARRNVGDVARAQVLLAEAESTAAALGMQILAADVRAAAARATEPIAREHLFRREGDYWSVGRPDALVRLRDSLGLRCLSWLLRNPTVEMHALRLLVAARTGEDGMPAHEAAGGDVLDGDARAAYRQRLAHLRASLRRARTRHDAAPLAALAPEVEFLTKELARGTGLHGRSRKAASATERARVNVTRTIRDAIRRIRAGDTALGRHLDDAVRTGTFCAYVPDAAQPVRWRF